MNAYAWSTYTTSEGHYALYRRVHRSEFELVKIGGEPVVYKSHDKAVIAAMAALIDIVNTDMRRDGERCTGHRNEAEKAFKGIGKTDDWYFQQNQSKKQGYPE